MSKVTSLEVAEKAGLPFHLIEMDEDKAAGFAEIRKLIEEQNVELIVLARFMQILPDDFCADYSGRIINIHHSFLPAFIGASPYKQAYERGVKLIGATCHYVTSELDALVQRQPDKETGTKLAVKLYQVRITGL